MAVEDYPAININLFQVQAEPGELEVVQGIALRELTPGEFFIDPQNDYGHPTNVTDSYNLVLGVSEALAANSTANGRVVQGSLPIDSETINRYWFREALGGDELDMPVQNPVGNVALVGMAQREGFTLTRVFPDPYMRTRELHAAAMNHGQDQRDHLAKLVLLSTGGELHVSVRGVRRPQVYSLQYIERNGGFLVVDNLGGGDEGGGSGGSSGGGPSPHDREPRTPIMPVSSAGAAAELPPQTEEESLQAIGQNC